MCAQVCTYTHISAYMHTHAHTPIHTDTPIHTQTCARTHVCAHTYAHKEVFHIKHYFISSTDRQLYKQLIRGHVTISQYSQTGNGKRSEGKVIILLYSGIFVVLILQNHHKISIRMWSVCKLMEDTY